MAGLTPLSLRVEVPPSELKRACAAASRSADPFAEGASFDSEHVRGRVLIEIGVPLDADPLLTFLREKRGLRLDPPITTALEQPVARVVGQLAGAAVLALHNEGEFTLPLRGGRGAITVGVEGDSFVLGVPLESYAGVVRLPKPDAAGAIAEACRDLAKVLRSEAALRRWPLLSFLDREAAILEGVAQPQGSRVPAVGEAGRWPADSFARSGSPTVASLASRAEAAGAHAVPYWRAMPGPEPLTVAFEPMRPQSKAAPRGALARYLLPGGEAALEAEIEGDAEGTARLRARLARPVPFSAQFGDKGLLRLLETTGTLPMA